MSQAPSRACRCPIGIAGADGKRPYEIALAVVAELMTLGPDLCAGLTAWHCPRARPSPDR